MKSYEQAVSVSGEAVARETVAAEIFSFFIQPLVMLGGELALDRQILTDNQAGLAFSDWICNRLPGGMVIGGLPVVDGWL